MTVLKIKNEKGQWVEVPFITPDTPSGDTSNLATKEELNQKQDVISDLETIRANASKGATAVQPEQLATVATSGSYNDLTDKPEIPESGGGETYTAGNGLNLINNNFELLQQDFGVKGVEVVGTLTGVNNVYGGFTKSDYLVIPSQLIINPEDDFEVQFKFDSGALSSSSSRYIYSCGDFFNMYTSNIDYLHIVLPTYSSGSNGYLFRDYMVSRTIYIVNIKRIVHGESYTHLIKVSTDDGESWTELVNKETTGYENKITGYKKITVGKNLTNGLIYLDKCFIKINGEDWWNPLNDTFRPVARATENLYGLVKPDNSTITVNDGVISTTLTDVQVNGTSVLSGGIANIPIATSNNFGVVKYNTDYGVGVTAANVLKLVSAGNASIDNKLNQYNPITPNNLDYAVKVGVTTNTMELTDEEKTNACNWLGAAKSEDAGGILTESYVNGTSWYRVYSDGWCEQGGFFAGSSSGVVNFLKSFKDTNYTITSCTDGASVYYQFVIATKYVDRFTCSYTGGSGGDAEGADWLACGYIS